MSLFHSSDHLKEVLGGFFEMLGHHPEVGPKLLASRLILKFIYREPDLAITIDLTGEQVVLSFNDTEKKPVVEMSMKADTAHRFWMGELNLVMALARREMTAKGPIPRILQLLPIIKPAYKIYSEYIKEKGLAS